MATVSNTFASQSKNHGVYVRDKWWDARQIVTAMRHEAWIGRSVPRVCLLLPAEIKIMRVRGCLHDISRPINPFCTMMHEVRRMNAAREVPISSFRCGCYELWLRWNSRLQLTTPIHFALDRPHSFSRQLQLPWVRRYRKCKTLTIGGICKSKLWNFD